MKTTLFLLAAMLAAFVALAVTGCGGNTMIGDGTTSAVPVAGDWSPDPVKHKGDIVVLSGTLTDGRTLVATGDSGFRLEATLEEKGESQVAVTDRDGTTWIGQGEVREIGLSHWEGQFWLKPAGTAISDTVPERQFRLSFWSGKG